MNRYQTLFVLTHLLMLLATGTLWAQTNSAPSNLTTTAIASNQVSLSWKDNSTGETGFEVWRTSDYLATSPVYTKVGEVGANVTSYTDNTVNATAQYGYRVRAFSVGTLVVYTAYSNQLVVTVPADPPEVPTDLAVTTKGSSLSVSWKAGGKTFVTFYTVQRAVGAGGSFQDYKSVSYAEPTGFLDNAVVAGQQYCYRVRATASGGSSAYTSAVCQTTPPEIPVTPTGLTVSVISSTKLQPYWNDSNVIPVTYSLERAEGTGGTYKEIANGYTSKIYNDDQGLNPSTQYCYRVRAKSSSGGYSNYSTPACNTTQAPPVTVPKAPTDLALQVQSARQINMIWKDNSDNETGFRVERSEDGGRTWTKVSDEKQNATSYDNTGLTPDRQYCYRVKAINSAGESTPSNQPCATTFPDKPSAPARLSATAISSSQIKLEWANTASNATGIQVERSETGSNGNFSKVKDLGPTETSWTDEGLTASKEYCYRLQAVNGAGGSGYTDTKCATTQAPPVIMPNPPTNLKATAVSASQINLSWTPSNSTFGSGYVIEQASPQGGSYKAIAEVSGLSTNSFSVMGLTASTQYCFRLRTKYTTNSDVSNEACQITPAPPVTVPRPPSNLKVEAQSSTVIRLTWDDNSDNESEFEIWWATSQTAQFVKLTSVSANQKDYTHTGLNANSPYCYQVRAVNSAGQSAFAGPQCATTPAPPLTPPAAPTDFVANPASITQMNLSWADKSNNETGFELQFSLNNADPWTSLPTQTSNVTTFAHTGLVANTRYYYRLRAVNAAGPSAWVTANNQTPALPVPATTTDLKAEVADYDQIKLTWGSITNTPTGIVIERSTSPAGSFTQVGQVSGTSTTFTDTGLPELTTFYYRIRATNANGSSGNSNVANAKTPESIISVRPQPLPEGIYAHVDHGTLFVTLNWNQFQEAQLRFIGLNGREQITDQCRINGGTLFQYGVAHLPAGVYVLCLDTDKNRFTKKIWIP